MKLIDWLLSSSYIASLNERIAEQRTDFAAQLAEKNTQIRSLRIELAQFKVENERLRNNEQRVEVRNGTATATPEKTDWQADLQKLLKEEEDGIRSGRRIQEHQSSTDDGA